MANRKDVAKRANVSITVVSRVMSKRGYVSQEKREAVLRAAEELNYRPSPVARSLQNGRTRQILFYRGNPSSAYYLELHRGMMDCAEKQGYLVCISGALHIERISELLMDGLILPTEAYAKSEYLRYLRKYNMPYVVIGYGEYIPKNVYSVTVDTGLAMREMVEYLRQKGHQRIAFINRIDTNLGGPRSDAFHSMMAKASPQNNNYTQNLNYGIIDA
jgi:DNA-binding LacI/PurR family transcriptional regulator